LRSRTGLLDCSTEPVPDEASAGCAAKDRGTAQKPPSSRIVFWCGDRGHDMKFRRGTSAHSHGAAPGQILFRGGRWRRLKDTIQRMIEVYLGHFKERVECWLFRSSRSLTAQRRKVLHGHQTVSFRANGKSWRFIAAGKRHGHDYADENRDGRSGPTNSGSVEMGWRRAQRDSRA